MSRKQKGILGYTILCLAMFCFGMSGGAGWHWLAFAWLAGTHGTYLFIAEKYMDRYDIQDAKQAEVKHQDFLNNLFIECLFRWPKTWLVKE